MPNSQNDVQLIRTLMIRLRDLICDAYTTDQFGELLYTNAAGEFDYDGLEDPEYKVRVFKTVKQANSIGQAKKVLWLAELAFSKRNEREDLKALVAEFKAAIEPGQQAAQGAPPGATDLPPDLETSLALLETNPPELMVDLRPKLRSAPYDPYDLPGRFHLSESEGRRLVAILALETYPSKSYLRWLSERVTVEDPFTGYVAAQALTTAALILSRTDLPRLQSALKNAAGRLDTLLEEDDEAETEFDIASRKRQLQLAESVVSMRLKGVSPLSKDDTDEFLASAAKGFDRPALEQLCRNRLQSALTYWAKKNDPVELIVVNIATTARDKDWFKEFVRAVCAERPNPTFTRIYNTYKAALDTAA